MAPLLHRAAINSTQILYFYVSLLWLAIFCVCTLQETFLFSTLIIIIRLHHSTTYVVRRCGLLLPTE